MYVCLSVASNANMNLTLLGSTSYFGVSLKKFRREIDFVNERVRTLAGNGTKGSDYQGGRKGTKQASDLTQNIGFFSHQSSFSDLFRTFNLLAV